jgi:pimeloyl-ACP methyl ester carboxylesterase
MIDVHSQEKKIFKKTNWSDPAQHKNGFVETNGVRLHYLDWGGSGPALILIHGYTDDPCIFDDLASAFTDRFRVIAYARRGHGQSDAKEPYDTATLTEDLRGLMDELGIAKAHLAGWSMGGNEITAMAGTHPERVDRIVYLDAAYDWGEPTSADAFKSLPTETTPTDSDMKSLDAYRARGDPARLAKNLACELSNWTPFRVSSIERVRWELPGVEIVNVPGTHKDFVFTSRDHVVGVMRRFLSGSMTPR